MSSSDQILPLAIGLLGTIGAAAAGLKVSRRLRRRLADEQAKRRAAEEELTRARELVESANSAKSQFLASMSHEIRTPMNGVVGLASLLLEGPLTEEQRDYVETIHASGESLLAIIGDILDASRIESGHLELVQEPFVPADTVRQVFQLMSSRAAEKRIGFRYDLSASVPARVSGDQSRLRQVLVNVLGNAIKFTDTGEVVLTVASRPVGPDDTDLLFTVSDTGIGVDAAVRARLFRPFSPGDSSLSRRYGGAGLGLAISKRLCELMGGRIELESEAGTGTKVRFTVRVGRASGQEPVASAPAPRLRPERILLAEDNLVNQKVAINMLKHLGYSADIAFNGREVLAAVERERYDVILMDVQMPEMDGLEAARRINESPPPGRLRPWIIAVTANTLPGDREACLAAGMDDYLGKPVKTRELEAALARAVQRDPAA